MTPNKTLVLKVLVLLRKNVAADQIKKQLLLMPGTVERIKQEFDNGEFPASWIEELNNTP